MSFPGLSANLVRVRERVADVQASAGLSHPVRLVAVTKGHPGSAVLSAVEAGLSDVGENRVQEALAKQEELGSVPVTWHMIGHLQTNKARLVPGRFGLVHSIDSLRLVRALETANRKAQMTGLEVLLQVNVAKEAQKSGCDVAEASEIAHGISECETMTLVGLMTMAPLTSDERAQRATFSELRRVRDQLDTEGLRVPELSMGMSNDYEAAVAEGATMLRLGTVLFGERPK